MSEETAQTIGSALSAGTLAQLRRHMKLVQLPAGTWLMRQGEPGDRFYIIEFGELEVLRMMEDDSERRIALHGAGNFVGEGSLFDRHGRRTADVRTRTDVCLLEMGLGEFDDVLQNYPRLAYEVVREVSRRLRETDSATIRDLQEKNRELTQAYAELTAAQALLIEKERLERELQLAREIQESSLPRRLPQVRNFTFGARMEPARAVGGDFYDFIVLDDDHLGVVIGDVSDKGVPAAIFMAMVRSLIRAEAARSNSPVAVLRNVNRHLMDMNEAGMFVTVLYGILHLDRREFRYARAGHEIPICIDTRGAAMPPAHGKGLVLGVFADSALDEQLLTLESGSTLLLYTDGATDAMDATGQLFGYKRLLDSIKGSLAEPAPMVCDRILDTIHRFHGKKAQLDDITLVCVAVN